ncbi:TPA: hypothetical protein P0E34_002428 [Vibrio campbellii]|nr:hypothetical protein [Vibrio campbellii]
MIREVEINQNHFFSIFADAVSLYDLSLNADSSDLSSRLAKASILSVNYALEAAANSCLESLELTEPMKDKIDRFSTIDKFDFVLQWHNGESLKKGDKHVQQIRSLVKLRNDHVHPKVKSISKKVKSEALNDKISYKHVAIESDVHPYTLDGVDSYTSSHALLALQYLVDFLNKFVIEWWGISLDFSTEMFITSWDGSTTADRYLYSMDDLNIVLKHEHAFRFKFLGLHGIREQFA